MSDDGATTLVIFLAFVLFWGECDLYDHLVDDKCVEEKKEKADE